MKLPDMSNNTFKLMRILIFVAVGLFALFWFATPYKYHKSGSILIRTHRLTNESWTYYGNRWMPFNESKQK